jgi:hypothetical protein
MTRKSTVITKAKSLYPMVLLTFVLPYYLIVDFGKNVTAQCIKEWMGDGTSYVLNVRFEVHCFGCMLESERYPMSYTYPIYSNVSTVLPSKAMIQR